MTRTYNIRCPLDQAGYAEGRTEFPNGTVRTIEVVAGDLIRVTWDDEGFWDHKH